ncbi:MAG: twin-arginine translocation signal domain-containing protein, partial [Planctomycetota bacterium]
MKQKFNSLEEALASERLSAETRRTFLSRSGVGLGAMALAMLSESSLGNKACGADTRPLAPKTPPNRAHATRVIYIHLA